MHIIKSRGFVGQWETEILVRACICTCLSCCVSLSDIGLKTKVKIFLLHQTIVKLFSRFQHDVSPCNSERAHQPEVIKSFRNAAKDVSIYVINHFNNKTLAFINLKIKKMISIPLMMEKPVRSPMVPPMRLSWPSILIFLSLSMSSKVAVSK